MLEIQAAVDADNAEVGAGRLGLVILQKDLQILILRILLQKATDTDVCLSGSIVSRKPVQIRQTIQRHRGIARRLRLLSDLSDRKVRLGLGLDIGREPLIHGGGLVEGNDIAA
jgi:hypothetical protein